MSRPCMPGCRLSITWPSARKLACWTPFTSLVFSHRSRAACRRLGPVWGAAQHSWRCHAASHPRATPREAQGSRAGGPPHPSTRPIRGVCTTVLCAATKRAPDRTGERAGRRRGGSKFRSARGVQADVHQAITTAAETACALRSSWSMRRQAGMPDAGASQSSCRTYGRSRGMGVRRVRRAELQKSGYVCGTLYARSAWHCRPIRRRGLGL